MSNAIRRDRGLSSPDAAEAWLQTGSPNLALPVDGLSFGANDAMIRDSNDHAPQRPANPSADPEQSRAPVRAVALIEGADFLRECVARGLSTMFPQGVEGFASPEDYLADERPPAGELIVFSTAALAPSVIVEAVALLAQGAAGSPILVLSYQKNFEIALAVTQNGAKGFIVANMDFQLALETARFIAAGGSYLPAELLGELRRPQTPPPPPVISGGVTTRELEVARAIRQGKPNKIIANDLNICESTVKVHIRHLMKKLQARNRTDIAIKSAGVLEGM
jgi:DNA-binding NarL/FixJ family response regulator